MRASRPARGQNAAAAARAIATASSAIGLKRDSGIILILMF